MRKVQTFDYMKRFRCIGPQCEDTCCNGWEVSLYKQDFKKIETLLKSKPELAPYRQVLRAKPANERVEEYHGELALTPQGCGMMVDGWCLLHRDYGEGMLPRVCATYPRHFLDLTEHLEVHGRLSCPEVARLCLLEEAAPELTEDAEPSFPEIYETNDWVEKGRDFYRKSLEKVAATVLDLLAKPGYTTQEKSYFILYLVSKLEAFFDHEASTEVAGRLERTLERGFLPEQFERMKANLAQVPLSDAVKTLLIGLINARLQGAQYGRYSQVIRTILRSYGAEGSQLAADGVLEPDDLPAMWRDFLNRRDLVQAAYAERMTRYLDRFAVNYWAQILYSGHQDLQAPMRKWLLYLAVTRFLWLSHPQVVAAAQAGMSEAEAAPVLDLAIVEVVQPLMKTIDANRVLSKSFLEAMDKLGFTSMTRLTELLSL